MADLILVRSDLGDGGWSLHLPGTSDEDIAQGRGIVAAGDAERLVDDDGDFAGWSRPTATDYALAEAAR